MDWTVMMSTYDLLIVVITLLIVGESAVTQNAPRTFNSHDVTPVNLSDVVRHSERLRRGSQAYPLTQKEVNEIVDLHNDMRAREGAADMELMTWNNLLASQAAKWAAKCVWGHGMQTAKPEYDVIGQNGFSVPGPKITVTDGVHAFYNEKCYYNTMKCVGRSVTGGPECAGHYRQMVRYRTRHVGCAVHRCEFGMYLVCNYGPNGGKAGERTFIKGPACSRCSTGAGWCKNRLCDNTCSTQVDNCPWKSCAALCYNCAKLNKETCRCECAAGWHGHDCTEVCEDKDERCNVGWPQTWCNHEKWEDYIQTVCPLMCKQCKSDRNAVEGACPPVYGPGAYLSASTRLMKSHHVMMMFVMIIITVNISNLDAAL